MVRSLKNSEVKNGFLKHSVIPLLSASQSIAQVALHCLTFLPNCDNSSSSRAIEYFKLMVLQCLQASKTSRFLL